ncbi:NAD-dependent epimerase/dehydratase family protein [Sporomusa acidovorans]|uniref:GDP-L-fucose synthase n=1 Tax=Sporomusa acidovorans (strain ATCC 49682 / DSM 3132 / Mol) TaxID=1123286 RepID=A0ABZ3J6P3_SPOA4|nr:NAD-dependent epimerase/dehydratase family protein [Sporomusa acidovorans]OZC23488.1 GDP-6-deoxy-D-mannose reductase [Sporomusa acidovorans DSM 3132]SDF28359.1 Nucleoside-diphosphate-sugar epimerase [Sporomusa acidovorans]
MRNRIIEEDICGIVTIKDIPWLELKGKTVLITGANGFIPAYIVETLLYINELNSGLKIKVIAVVRNGKKALARFEHYTGRKDIKFIVQDVCEPISIKENIDYIIHAASQASPKYYGVDPVGTILANVIGTYNLLELARAKKVKGFLYFSSGEIYGEVAENQIPTGEAMYGNTDPLNIRSCYGESKRMGETMCISYMHQFGIPIKIVRPFHTYGPGMLLDDGRVFADFVSDIVNRRDIEIKSDGTAVRVFCYLADAVEGFFRVMLIGKTGEAYNLASDFPISILNLAKLLVQLFPERNLRVLKKSRNQTKNYIESKISRAIPDIKKLKSLGWVTRHSIQEGFARTVQSFEIC